MLDKFSNRMIDRMAAKIAALEIANSFLACQLEDAQVVIAEQAERLHGLEQPKEKGGD